ncbi:hypothetical protein TYRP_010347 [Tyrophagus putrescentiae]|nr:hypothetical protein TYRP_010347 [Tyrophagus putrescentiae]
MFFEEHWIELLSARNSIISTTTNNSIISSGSSSSFLPANFNHSSALLLKSLQQKHQQDKSIRSHLHPAAMPDMPGPVAYDSHHHHRHPHQSQDDNGIDGEGVSPTEVLLTTDFWTIFTVEDLRISSKQAMMDSLAFFSLIVCQSTNETATFFSACHLLTNVFIHANQHCAAFLLLLLLFLGALIASVVLLCWKFDFDSDSDSGDADDYNHSSATPLNIVIEVNAVPAAPLLLAPLPLPPTTFTTITRATPLKERFFESPKISDQSQPVLQNEAQKSPGGKVDRNTDPETAAAEVNNQQQHSPADYSQLLEKVVASLLKENASKSIYSGSLLLSSDHLGDLLSESCIRLPHSKYFYTNTNNVNNVDNNHHFESAQQLTESQVKAALEQCYALAAAAKGAKGSAAAAAESTESTAALSAESKQQQNQEESSEAAVIPPPAHSLPANMVLQRFGHQLQRPGSRKGRKSSTSKLQTHSTLLSPLLLPPPPPPTLAAEPSCSPSSCDSPPPLQSRWLVRRWHYRGTGK